MDVRAIRHAEERVQPVVTCACPYVDRNDARCGRMFSLGQIDRVFALCMDGYRRCPIFHVLTREDRINESGIDSACASARRYLELHVDDDAIRNATTRRIRAAAS